MRCGLFLLTVRSQLPWVEQYSESLVSTSLGVKLRTAVADGMPLLAREKTNAELLCIIQGLRARNKFLSKEITMKNATLKWISKEITNTQLKHPEPSEQQGP